MDDFEKIYRQYFKPVFFYALSLCREQTLAEEITQETFFRALNTKARFQGRAEIQTWLCQIAKNNYFAILRKESKFTYDAPQEEPSGVSIEDELLKKDTAIRIHILLHRLEEPYKEVFSLRLFSELPYRDIAAIFGKTESWARVTYSRAKVKLKKLLEEDAI